MSDYSAVAPPPTQNQSSAFAAALQRARQIAAKINPTSASNPDIKLKRSLEDGSEPEAKKLAPDPLLGLRGQAGLGDPSGGLRGPPQASSPPHGIGAGLGGNCVEDIRVPDKMVGLIIGRGGEQITRLQSETGCKIQMAPESGGLPDRVCTLTGSREAVNRAKERVLSIVNDRCRAEGLGESNMGGSSNSSGSGSIGGGGSSSVGGGGGGSGQMMSGHPGSVEIMIPGPKVGLIIGKGGETIKQLQEKSGAKMVVIQDGPSQEQEKPLRITGDPQKVEYAKNLVYELIAEKEMQMFQRGGPRGGSERSNSFSNDNGFNHGGAGGGGGSGGGASPDGVEVLVPRAAVGVVIGKGGDMIKKIQSETGARVQFQQGREDGPGDRKCLLSGKPQAVEQARQKIQELIDSRRDDRNPMGGGRGGGAPGGAGGNGGGPRGNGFGAGRPNEYGGWDRRNSGGSMENKIETTYKVPSTKCGIIIGKGGETIKQINQQTGAHCELDRNNQNFDNNEKTFIIRGTPEQVEHAKRIFTEKLGGGGGGMGGAPYGGGGGQGAIGYNPSWNPNSGYQTWPNQGQPNDGSNPAQQVQMNPQTGQPDYSAQWVEYYRSLGMHREAEIIEQQSKQVKTEHPQQQQQQQQQQPAPPGSAGGVAGQQPQAAQQQPQAQQVAAQNGAQADYSAQWAEYYRSMGKIQEAEAIEAQMKSGKMGTPGNQMAQSQMQQPQQQQQQQQKIQGQPGNPTAPATPNAFPQAYGTYPGMNPGGGPGGYYPTGGANAGGNNSAQQQQQQQPGQQNPNFGGGMGYQNYPYSQQNSDN